MLVLAASLLACEERAAPVRSNNSDHLVRRQDRFWYSGDSARPAAVALEGITVTGVQLPPVPAEVTNMVIRTANISIEVDSLEPAIGRVRELASQFGGYVASTDIATGKHQLRKATLEVKVPATRFDASLAGLSPIGTLESVSVEAEDVGEQFVDVTARMENARRLERRLIDLLATRTGKLKDVLDVEQALARVREEIERYEGRIRYLRAHTAMSTLSVHVHEPVPIVASAGRSVMGEALRQSWRNFVALLSALVQSLGVVLPLGLVAFGVWIVTRRVRSAKQRTA